MAPTTPPEPDNGHTLEPTSKDAVDKLLEDGFDASGEGSEPHDVALREVLGLLDSYPVEESSDALIDATLARIDRHEATHDMQMNFEENDTRRVFSRWRRPDIIATAAAIFLALGIGWPLWQTMQQNRIQGISQARLAGIGSALAGFAGDNDDALPLDSVQLSQPFDPVNTPHSRHLVTVLPKGAYLDRAILFLGSPQAPAASFSYRVPHLRTAFRLRIIGPSAPLAGDANPILWRLRTKMPLQGHLGGSRTHAGRGQIILHGDLSTSWDDIAMLLSDPIWTSIGCPNSSVPICEPTSKSDIFLAD